MWWSFILGLVVFTAIKGKLLQNSKFGPGERCVMVQEQFRKGKKYYFCDKCGFGYEEPHTASQCQEYCMQNNKCSEQITRKALFR